MSGISDPVGLTQRVLVVDDDPIFCGLAAAALTSSGFHVETAADGAEGLECLDRVSYDLALIDLTMPRIDGFRMIALIRGSSRLRQLAIMVVSARHDADACHEALTLGADAVETKPLDFARLGQSARELIAAVRTRRAALRPREPGRAP